MSDEQWNEVVKNNEMINGVLMKIGERLEHLEKYVQALPTPDKTMYRPPNHEEYLNIKENYDLLYRRLEALENGMQETK
jgi:hypothetical protein|tara:strand:+ start:893 stop:1129 length:237 start_codon:yes stop_codon:yes gene_type:complete